MKEKDIEIFFNRNGKNELDDFIDGANDFDDPFYLLVSVIDDGWEYGYGDYTFKYDVLDEFLENGRNDVYEWGDFNDIRSLVLEVVYYNSEDPEEAERVEIDEI